jgi:hypothetical protein
VESLGDRRGRQLSILDQAGRVDGSSDRDAHLRVDRVRPEGVVDRERRPGDRDTEQLEAAIERAERRADERGQVGGGAPIPDRDDRLPIDVVDRDVVDHCQLLGGAPALTASPIR